MNKNKKIGLVVAVVIALFGAFWIGMVYGKSQVPTRGSQAFGQNGQLGARGGRNGGEFANGQIIAKDANSITVQLTAGGAGPGGQGGQTSPTTTSGSKIIFFDSNTKITKSVDGTTADLNTGTQVTVTGTPNSDGSINATAVQIRPNVPPAVLK